MQSDVLIWDSLSANITDINPWVFVMAVKKTSPDALEKVAICKKTTNGEVLSQNDLCVAICGHRKGKICTDNCMHEHKTRNTRKTQGTNRYENVVINGKEYDILMLDDGELLTTLLFDLTEKNKADIVFFQQFNLTEREMEIVELLMKRNSNVTIADKLCISLPTLKTHINHIFKKVPRKFLERNRRN